MKPNKIYLLLNFCILISLVNAQDKEFKINEATYKLNLQNNSVENVENHIKVFKGCETIKCDLVASDFYPIILSSFPKDTLISYAQKGISFGVTFICNQKSKVCEVKFRIPKVEITKDVIKSLHTFEKYYVGQKIDLINYCPDIEFFPIHWFIQFSKIPL